MIFFRFFLSFFIVLNLFCDDNVSLESTPELVSKNLYISYEKVPDEIYKNQQFKITLKAIITTSLWDSIDTKFHLDENSSLSVNYDKSPGWKWIEDNTYHNEYYLKANEKITQLPKITVSIYNEDFELLEQVTGLEKEIAYRDIIGNSKYSDIVSSSLRVISQNTKQYNNNTLMSVIELEATQSNLKDFYLKEYEQQGTQSYKDEGTKQTLIYYVMVPIYKNKIEFSYYNFKNKRYENISIPIELEQQLISTQTDLNPSNSNLLIYKQIGVLVALLFLLVIYYFKRSVIFLLAIIASIVFFIYTFIPNQTGYLRSGTSIYILPTKNSTLFEITSTNTQVEILNKKQKYIKVLLPNKTIGWVKKNDIIKN